MKARCTHGAPWFMECPWCESEYAARTAKVQYSRTAFPWWRNMSVADIQEWIRDTPARLEHEAKVGFVHGLLERALEHYDRERLTTSNN